MEGQNQNDELYPIAVLIDELKVGYALGFSRDRRVLTRHSTMMYCYDSTPYIDYQP